MKKQQKKSKSSGSGIVKASVDGDKALIKSQGEASQIYSKGFFGTPQSGGSLILDALDTVYLAEMKRISVFNGKKEMTMEDVVRWGAKSDTGFEVKYLVYREMRQRGYVAKRGAGDIDFRVFPRGGKPGSTPSKYWLVAVSERWGFSLESAREMHARASNALKSLLVGVADEEGDITYYVISERNGFSSIGECEGPLDPVKAFLMEDRVMIFHMESAKNISETLWYGQLGSGFLLLSLLEASYLQELGWISVCDTRTGRRVSSETLMRRGRDSQETFDLRLEVYRDLRKLGLIVKTGFKYGTHFRVYDQDHRGHHARFLVHALPRDHVLTWSDVSRAVRLAHGVKKELLFASSDGCGNIEYVRVRRITP